MFAEKSVQRLSELQAAVDKVLGAELALHRPVDTGSVRANTREFGGEKAVDGTTKPLGHQ